MTSRRTRQRWWSARNLGRIRLGVEMGRYHFDAQFHRRYHEVLAKSALLIALGDPGTLLLYERGLLAGHESAARRV